MPGVRSARSCSSSIETITYGRRSPVRSSELTCRAAGASHQNERDWQHVRVRRFAKSRKGPRHQMNGVQQLAARERRVASCHTSKGNRGAHGREARDKQADVGLDVQRDAEIDQPVGGVAE